MSDNPYDVIVGRMGAATKPPPAPEAAPAPQITAPRAPAAPAAEAPANPYDAIVERAVEPPPAKLVLDSAGRTDADKFAQARKLGIEFGIPAEVVERNLEEVQARKKVLDGDAALENAPATKGWLQSNPENAKLSHDQISTLAGFEDVVRQMADTDASGSNTVTAMDVARSVPAGAVKGAGAIAGIATAGAAARGLRDRALAGIARAAGLETLAKMLEDPTLRELREQETKAVEGVGAAVKSFGESIGPTNKNFLTDVGEGVGQVGMQITALLMTGGLGGGAILFGQGADQAAADVKKSGAEGTAGGDLGVLAGGATTALIEKFGLGVLMKKLPENVQSKIFRVLLGAGTEGASEILEDVANNVTALALYDHDRVLFGDDTLYQGGVGAAVGALVSAAIPGRRAIRRREHLTKVIEDVQSSPLAQRAPDKAVEHAAAVLDTNNVDIYVSGVRLAEEAGPERLTELGLDRSVEQAIERGGDVRLTNEQFAKLAQEGVAGNLADDVRVGEGSMTAAEAKAVPDEEAQKRADARDAETMAEAEKAAPAAPTEGAEWKANQWQRRQLIAAGFGKEEIEGMSQQDVLDLVGEKPPSPDRWHAEAHEPVALAEDQLGLQAMFATAQEAGMTDQQYASYLAALEEAGDGARKRATERAIKRQQKQLTAEWQAEREVVRQQTEESVRQLPVYSALDGLGVDRLDANAIVEIMGQESILEILPKSNGRQIFQRRGGIHPDVYAELYGFEDGRTMIDEMMAALPIKEKIEAETDRKMAEKHGAILNKQRDLQEALEDLHQDKEYFKVLTSELKALRGEAKKGGALDPALFRATASAGLAQQQIRDINPKLFLDEEARKGKLAGKLIRGKGKVDGEKLGGSDRSAASKAKFEQILNFEYARQAFEVRREVEAQRKHLADLADPSKAIPGIDAGHRDRLLELLSGYDFSKGFVRDPAGLRETVHYGNMSLGAFAALHRQAKAIETEGRKWRSLVVGGKALDFEEAKAQLLDRLAKLPELPRMQREAAGDKTLFDRARSVLASAQATLSKVELVIKKLDGGELGGPWHKTVFQPLADAQSLKLDLYQEALTPIIEGAKGLPDAIGKRLDFKIPNVSLGGRKVSYAEALMVALNSGNASNSDKLIEGSQYIPNHSKWTPEEVQAALDALPPEAAPWVQSVFDRFEKIRPMVEEVYRGVYGISPSRIEPRKFKVGGVEVKGGYFPMMYDQRATAELKESSSEALNMMLHPGDRAGVFSGMTKAREENYAAPVSLEFSGLAHSIERHLHFVSHFEAFNNTRKILENRDISAEISARLGPEYRDELHRWLDAVATNNADFKTSQGANRLTQIVRSHITIGVLGLSYTTMASQALGLSTSVAVLGAGPGGKFSAREGVKWMAVGVDRYVADTRGSVELAKELSGEMRHRLGNADREQAEALRQTAHGGNVYTLAQRASLKAIGGMQFYVVDMPTWIGAFNQGLSRDMSERQAADYADAAVRTSQGSGHLKDQASLQRQKGLTQWLTMFSTYTTLLYGLVSETVGATVASPKRLPSTIIRMVFLLVLAAAGEALIRQDFPNEEDDAAKLAKWGLKSMLVGVKSTPVVGQLIASEVEGFKGGGMSPVEGLGTKTAEAFKSMVRMVEEGEVNLKDARKVLNAAGLAAGLPGTTQLVRVMKAIEEESENPYDYLVTPKKK